MSSEVSPNCTSVPVKKHVIRGYPYIHETAMQVIERVGPNDHVTLFDRNRAKTLMKLKDEALKLLEDPSKNLEIWVGQPGTHKSYISNMRRRMGKYGKMSLEELAECEEMVQFRNRVDIVQPHVPELPAKYCYIVAAQFWKLYVKDGTSLKDMKVTVKPKKQKKGNVKTVPVKEGYFNSLPTSQRNLFITQVSTFVFETFWDNRLFKLYSKINDQLVEHEYTIKEVQRLLEAESGEFELYLGQERAVSHRPRSVDENLEARMGVFRDWSNQDLLQSEETVSISCYSKMDTPKVHVIPVPFLHPILSQCDTYCVVEATPSQDPPTEQEELENSKQQKQPEMDSGEPYSETIINDNGKRAKIAKPNSGNKETTAKKQRPIHHNRPISSILDDVDIETDQSDDELY